MGTEPIDERRSYFTTKPTSDQERFERIEKRVSVLEHAQEDPHGEKAIQLSDHEQRLAQLESERAGERLEEAERRLNLHDGRLAKLEKDEQFCWTVATDCDQRLREIEQRPPETPSQQVQAEREADLSLLRGASAALVKMNQRADFLQAENEQLRVKLAEADEEIGQMSRRLDKKRTELSQMANAYASEKHLAETRAWGANRLEAELVSERKCRDSACQRAQELESEVQRMLAINTQACAVRDAEIQKLRETNQAHLKQTERLDQVLADKDDIIAGRRAITNALTGQMAALRADLAEARSAGLSIGNAALKYGWVECEAAICAWLAKNPHIGGNVNIYDSLAADIRAGDHRPEGFDPADRASGMGQELPEGVLLRGVRFQARCEEDVPLVDALNEVARKWEWKRDSRVHAGHFMRKQPMPWTGTDEIVPEEGRDPFAYPAGLPEEDPGSAPEEVRLGTVAAGLVDPEPLRELAEEVRSWDPRVQAFKVLERLREAGVIPGADLGPKV